MTEKEKAELERIKREIGWHCTPEDVVFICCMIALIWFVVAVSS